MNEPIYVIGYARVSTPKQAQTGESLGVQEEKIKSYCKKMNWQLFPEDTVHEEPFTGTNTNRPKYKEILELLKNNGKGLNIKYFVFWDFDRLTRAGSVDYEKIWRDVKEYGVSLRDASGIIQDEVDMFSHLNIKKTYEFAIGRPSEDAERQKIEDARKERTKILRRLIEPQIRLVQEGYHIGVPDYGYENKKIFVENKKRCIQFRYEAEAKFLELGYKLRAEGIKTDKEIVETLNTMGYKSRTTIRWSKDKAKQIGTGGGIKLTEKHFQSIVSRTSYCGVISKVWTNNQPIRAKYKSLVTIAEWNKANKGKVFIQENNDGTLEILKNIGVHGKKRYKYNPTYKYRGILKCDICRKVMKGSASSGKSKAGFPVYHCENSHKRYSHKLREVDEVFKNFFDSVKFTTDFISILEKMLIWKFKEKEGEFADITAKANTNVSELEIQKSQLIKSFGNAKLKEVQESIEQEISKLQTEIIKARSHRDKLEIKENDISEFLQWCKKIMEHPHKILENINSPDEQRELFSLFFEEMPSYTELVKGTPKLTFVFKLNQEFHNIKSDVVSPLGIGPRSRA